MSMILMWIFGNFSANFFKQTSDKVKLAVELCLFLSDKQKYILNFFPKLLLPIKINLKDSKSQLIKPTRYLARVCHKDYQHHQKQWTKYLLFLRKHLFLIMRKFCDHFKRIFFDFFTRAWSDYLFFFVQKHIYLLCLLILSKYLQRFRC